MGHPDGAHTHGSGGSGLGTAVLVLIGAALAVKAAPAVLSAPAELLHALIIMTAVIVGVGAAGLVGLLTWRWHRTRLAAARAMPPLPSKLARAAQPLPQPRPAIERAPKIHLRLHGITAEDVAAILRGRDDP